MPDEKQTNFWIFYASYLGWPYRQICNQGEMSPEVVEDVKQNMDTDDTRDKVLDVCQPQRELRNSYPVDGRNPSPPTSLSPPRKI